MAGVRMGGVRISGRWPNTGSPYREHGGTAVPYPLRSDIAKLRRMWYVGGMGALCPDDKECHE